MDSLDGMTRTFANPYIIFYPVIPRIGDSFPVNRTIRDIQGGNFNEDRAWRGNIVVAKYRSGGVDPFLSMIDISMADFPLLRNYFLNHEPNAQVGRGPTRRVELLLTHTSTIVNTQQQIQPLHRKSLHSGSAIMLHHPYR